MIQISKGRMGVIKRENVNNLISLITLNNYILELIYLMRLEFETCVSEIEKKEVMEVQLDIAVMSGYIKESERPRIREIVNRFDAKDYGELLEVIIEQKGPFDKDRNKNEIGRECKFFHPDIQGRHNMDVVFYSSDCKYIKGNNTVCLEGNVELHECKNNISNWLPKSKEDLNKAKNKKVKDKLEFINSIYAILSEKGRYYLPTFSIEVEAKQKCLDDWGYSFLRILNIMDLQKLFVSP